MTEMRNRTVLGADCRMSGDLHLDNDAVVMGQFDGTLRVTGQLELPGSARVRGTVACGNVRLAGRVEGNLIVEDTLELLAEATIHGEVFATHLISHPDAEVDGRVVIGSHAMQRATELLEIELGLGETQSVAPRVEQVAEGPEEEAGDPGADEQASWSAETDAWDGAAAVDEQEAEPVLVGTLSEMTDGEQVTDRAETPVDADEPSMTDEGPLLRSHVLELVCDDTADEEMLGADGTVATVADESEGEAVTMLAGGDQPEEMDEQEPEAPMTPRVMTYSHRLNDLLQRRRRPRVLKPDGTTSEAFVG